MGRNYRTESNLRSNLYVVGIADSGSGKNHAREIINETFFEAGLAHHLGGNKIASGAGLLTALHRQPAILFQIDEFGMFLSAAADRKRSPRHITEILDNMTELYTSAGGIFLGAEYANRDGTNERRDINQPCLCVYGTTTPLHFWGALQGANVVDGSLARFLILPSDEDYPDENIAVGIRHAPPALIQGLQLVAAGGGGKKGNLTGKTADQNTAVNPMIVPMTEEARARFRQLSIELTEELRAAVGTAFTAILARIGENALKLALIVAVGRDPASPKIEITAADWAISFVRHYAQRTMEAVERHVADSHAIAEVTGLQTALNGKAALASPSFTGTPTAPTATGGTNTTQIATTAFVQSALTGFGAGDMLKATYDSNNNGKVDTAEAADSVPWTGVTGKPTSFTPATHSHAVSQVTGLQTALDDKAGVAGRVQ